MKSNKFLLARNEFMPEIDLSQPRFTWSAYRLFTKKKERIQKVKGTPDLRYVNQKELYKAWQLHGLWRF